MLGGEVVALEVALAVSCSLAREVVAKDSEFRATARIVLILRSNDGLRQDVLFDDFPLERETACSIRSNRTSPVATLTGAPRRKIGKGPC